MINPSQRPLPDNTQQSQQTNIHAPGGIRTHNLSRRAAVDLRLRPRGHWDRSYSGLFLCKIKVTSFGVHNYCRSVLADVPLQPIDDFSGTSKYLAILPQVFIQFVQGCFLKHSRIMKTVYLVVFPPWRKSPQYARAASLWMLHDRTQIHHTW